MLSISGYLKIKILTFKDYYSEKVAKVFYNLDVSIDVLSEELEGDTTHVIFKLNFENGEYDKMIERSNASMTSIRKSQAHAEVTALPIKSEIFFELFPFHIVFKTNLEIVSIGCGLNQAMTHSYGESIKDLFNLNRPLVSFTWENVSAEICHETKSCFPTMFVLHLDYFPYQQRF